MCTRGGAAATTKELGPFGTRSRRTVRDKFDAFGVHCLFWLAMHPAGRVKTSALLTSDI